MAGSVWGRDSSSNFFSTSNHFSTNWKTWLRAIFTPAIPPPCALGFKNGSFWGQNQATMAGSPRDPGINVETLERLKSQLHQYENMVKCLFCHPSPVCNGGVKNAEF